MLDLSRVFTTLFWLVALLNTTSTWAQTAENSSVFSAPTSIKLQYDFEGVIGSPYKGSAELQWQRDANSYTSQLAIRKFGISLQTWTSKGTFGTQGLEPARFGSKRLGSEEISANFVRAANKVTFSAGTPDAVLAQGAQDQLSIFMQLAGILAADPQRGATGTAIKMQAIGDRYAEHWSFKASPPETIKLPGGSFLAIKMTHEATVERRQKLELWYVPAMNYLPLRIRITEDNGDYLDMLWASSQKP